MSEEKQLITIYHEAITKWFGHIDENKISIGIIGGMTTTKITNIYFYETTPTLYCFYIHFPSSISNPFIYIICKNTPQSGLYISSCIDRGTIMDNIGETIYNSPEELRDDITKLTGISPRSITKSANKK